MEKQGKLPARKILDPPKSFVIYKLCFSMISADFERILGTHSPECSTHYLFLSPLRPSYKFTFLMFFFFFVQNHNGLLSSAHAQSSQHPRARESEYVLSHLLFTDRSLSIV